MIPSPTSSFLKGSKRLLWVALALPLACDGSRGHSSARHDGLEPPSLTALGVFCSGEGDERRCRDRGLEASDFVCEGSRCLQRHVRLPDDGEWRCAEREGVVWCAGGEPAAGVVTAASQRGFRCGTRRAPADDRNSTSERICVDPSPDYPRGARGRYACRFLLERGISRECVERPSPVRAVAETSAPDCWLDRDCVGGRCDRGTCTEGGS